MKPWVAAMMVGWWLASALPSPAATAPPVAGLDPAQLADAARRVRADVEFLAADELEGRDTGSRGHRIAADYVAAQFRAMGLAPGGSNGGWLVEVPFRRAEHRTPPRLTLTVGGRAQPLVNGRDAALAPSLTEADRHVTARLVFVGYGLDDRRFGYHDYAGLDLTGRIAVAVHGTPAGLPREIAAHLGASKAAIAAAHGAIGLVELPRPGEDRGGLDRQGQPRLSWVDGEGHVGNQPPGLRVGLSVSRATAEHLFDHGPASLAAIERGPGSPRGFALDAAIQIEASDQWRDFSSPEVIGRLAGGDPAVAGEQVALMAHLDHLGIDPAPRPGADAIFNGALDNAAGVATMLEAARETTAGPHPRRAMLFIANTGEEKGLLGANYLADHPPAGGPIVGVVDLDMPLLLYPFTDVSAFGADHSTIAEAVASAGRTMGVAVSPDPLPEQSLFIRSDHYMFVKRGVPAVLLMTGFANGGAAEWRRFLATTYHSPRDDLSQAIDWQAGRATRCSTSGSRRPWPTRPTDRAGTPAIISAICTMKVGRAHRSRPQNRRRILD